MIINESFENGIHAVSISEAGAKHKATNLPNQDCCAFMMDGESFLIAVADGVGSCKYAEQASLKACSICQDLFQDMIKQNLKPDGVMLVETLTKKWLSYLSEKDSMEYCTTLKAVFQLDSKLILISIGDGLLMASSGSKTVMAPSDQCDFLNETTCLSSKLRSSDIWVTDLSVASGICTIFISTDGVSNGIISGQEMALLEELRDHIGTECLRDELISFFNEVRLHNADDKTVGVVKYDHQDG